MLGGKKRVGEKGKGEVPHLVEHVVLGFAAWVVRRRCWMRW